uniref:Uncharacterized protein n=1 Tax=viral metagenome TaxID=1070528 RepID=A0A6C0LSK7_9ZZZZ
MSFEFLTSEMTEHILSFIQKEKDILNTNLVCQDFNIHLFIQKITLKNKKKFNTVLSEWTNIINHVHNSSRFSISLDIEKCAIFILYHNILTIMQK